MPGRQCRRACEVARQAKVARQARRASQVRPAGHHVLGGRCTYQVSLVRPPCAEGVARLLGESDRLPCAGGVVRRSGESVMQSCAWLGLAITLVSLIFFPLLLEECDITVALGHTPSQGPVG